MIGIKVNKIKLELVKSVTQWDESFHWQVFGLNNNAVWWNPLIADKEWEFKNINQVIYKFVWLLIYFSFEITLSKLKFNGSFYME